MADFSAKSPVFIFNSVGGVNISKSKERRECETSFSRMCSGVMDQCSVQKTPNI